MEGGWFKEGLIFFFLIMDPCVLWMRSLVLVLYDIRFKKRRNTSKLSSEYSKLY